MQQNFTASNLAGRVEFATARIRANRSQHMKNVLWMVGGFCAAAAGLLVWSPGRTQPVELLAHRLEVAWADHHTVVEAT
jgi:hypothetical protein